MGKFKSIANKIINIILLMGVTAVFTYFASVGTLHGEGNVAFTTAGRHCDANCANLTGGKVELNGSLVVQRNALHCEYISVIHGELHQDYWAGPWTYEDGDALPEGLHPPLPDVYQNDDRLREAKRDKDGKPVCPKSFDLTYGQRGLYAWAE